MSQVRETLEESGCSLVALTPHDGEVILKDNDLKTFQVWQRRDDYAGYVIVINGVGYEFVRSALASDLQYCLPIVPPKTEHWHEDFELESRKREAEMQGNMASA